MHKNYFKCLFCLRQKDFLFRLLVAVEKMTRTGASSKFH